MKEELKQQIAEQISEEVILKKGPDAVNEYIIREGKALELKEPVKVAICGNIDAPQRFLSQRKDCINQKNAYVIVNRENMTIKLKCDENNFYGSEVTGKMELSQEYLHFGINNGKYITNFEMAELIKMNRSFFENRMVAMKLVSELQNFRAKVDKEIENSNNNRGDRRMLVNQVVQSNLPEAFNLIIPLFKGTPKSTIQVEVYVNPNDFSCTLVSPEAVEIMQGARDNIIDSVLTEIINLCPGIVIIEQ